MTKWAALQRSFERTRLALPEIKKKIRRNKNWMESIKRKELDLGKVTIYWTNAPEIIKRSQLGNDYRFAMLQAGSKEIQITIGKGYESMQVKT